MGETNERNKRKMGPNFVTFFCTLWVYFWLSMLAEAGHNSHSKMRNYVNYQSFFLLCCLFLFSFAFSFLMRDVP